MSSTFNNDAIPAVARVWPNSALTEPIGSERLPRAGPKKASTTRLPEAAPTAGARAA